MTSVKGQYEIVAVITKAKTADVLHDDVSLTSSKIFRRKEGILESSLIVGI
jgi:hypothetical protein